MTRGSAEQLHGFNYFTVTVVVHSPHGFAHSFDTLITRVAL